MVASIALGRGGKAPGGFLCLWSHTDDGRYLAAYIERKKQMMWIILSWTSFASVLFALSVYAWRNLFKTERIVRPYIDDIPFRPNRYRHND
jgi:hypothetical protein